MKISNSIKIIVVMFLMISAPFSVQAKQNNWENVIVTESNTAFRPELAFGGGKFGVLYYDRRNGNAEIYFNLIKKNVKEIGNDVRITNDSADSMDPNVVWNGKDFGIFWRDSWKLYYARISKKGEVILDKTLIIENGVHPSVVWNQKAQEYGFTWWGSEDNDPTPGGARFVRLDRKGNKLSQVIPLNSVNGGGYYRPRIDTDGDGYGVSWSDIRTSIPCREVVFAYVNANGEKIGTDKVLTSTGAEHLNTMVWNSNEFAIITYGNAGISLTRVSSDGTLLQFSPLTGNPPFNNNMGLAWDKDHYILSTIGKTDIGGVDILMANFDRYGNIIGDFTAVSTSPQTDYYPSKPVKAGGDIAVSWVANLWEVNQNISFAKSHKSW